MGLRHFDRIYYFDLQVRIVYVLLLSWGGDSLDEPEIMNAIGTEAHRGLIQSVDALHRREVDHTGRCSLQRGFQRISFDDRFHRLQPVAKWVCLAPPQDLGRSRPAFTPISSIGHPV